MYQYVRNTESLTRSENEGVYATKLMDWMTAVSINKKGANSVSLFELYLTR